METMVRPSNSFLKEHEELLPQIERIRAIADSVDDVPVEVLRFDIDDVCDFLETQLMPHAKAEDYTLYPVVERIMQAPGATATMQRDHAEILLLTQELLSLKYELIGRPLDPYVKDLRRVLYGLYAILKLHFAKEEELYLPVLDGALTAEDAEDLLENMAFSTIAARGGPVD